MPTTPPPKPCTACGREITWRKKWARDWDNVKYCSDACRRKKGPSADAAVEQAILRLLAARGVGKTICPSEAARAVDPAGWRELMEPARAAARRLAAAGEIEVTQNGHAVNPSRAKGPVRLRLKRA